MREGTKSSAAQADDPPEAGSTPQTCLPSGSRTRTLRLSAETARSAMLAKPRSARPAIEFAETSTAASCRLAVSTTYKVWPSREKSIAPALAIERAATGVPSVRTMKSECAAPPVAGAAMPRTAIGREAATTATVPVWDASRSESTGPPRLRTLISPFRTGVPARPVTVWSVPLAEE